MDAGRLCKVTHQLSSLAQSVSTHVQHGTSFSPRNGVNDAIKYPCSNYVINTRRMFVDCH